MLCSRLLIDLEKFLSDSKSHAVLSKIDNDFESGVRSGVNGTPTFFIDGSRLNSYNESYESLETAVKNAEGSPTRNF